MDFSDQSPQRFWITNPADHIDHLLISCGGCNGVLDYEHSIPYKTYTGGLCQNCATKDISDHPMTPTYLDWMLTGDPRWWSSWTCNCKGCVPNEVSNSGICRSA